MTQPIHLIADAYIGCKIPAMVAQVSIDPVFNELYWWSHEGVETTLPLPPGSWQIISTTKECTEEQAKVIVGSSEWFFPERHTRYIDYEKPIGPDGKQAWNVGFSNGLLSLRSLLVARGCDPNKNYIIIKRVSKQ